MLLNYHAINFSSIITIMFCLVSSTLLSQADNDSITLVNGNIIACEIIKLENNRLEIDASYGYGNWEVKWHNVTSIKTVNSYNVQLENGQRFYGKLETTDSAEVLIISDTGLIGKVQLQEIAFLMEYKSSFIQRLEGSISLGVNITKARDFRSLTTANRLAYNAKNYKLGIRYNALTSSQESTELIQRSDGSFNYSHDLPHQYFSYLSTSLLSNTEQRIDLRWSTQIGLEKLLISNNQLDWRIILGANYNIEQFFSESPDRKSTEALLGTKFDIFNIGDLKFYTNIKSYYSITENDRFEGLP